MKKLLLVALIFASQMLVFVFAQPNPNEIIKKSKSESFIENKGQIVNQYRNVNNDVLFIAEVPGGAIYIKEEGISFALIKFDSSSQNQKNRKIDVRYNPLMEFDEDTEKIQLDIYRVDMVFKNSLTSPKIFGKEMLDDYNNYYLSHCPDGITFVRKFKKIYYENIYNKIDFVAYFNDAGKFQYDFIIKPGGNPNDILINFEGAENISILDDGRLKIETPFGNIEQCSPYTYQDKLIESGFKLQSDKSLTFNVGEYDKSQLLIIDPPTRLWGTYYGGNDYDEGNDVVTDVSGNIFITGSAYSTNAIATSGAYQENLNGVQEDAILIKFNSNGIRQWGTYYGGTSGDYGYNVCIDISNNVYMSGRTMSSNGISTIGCHQENYGGGTNDAFLVKFNTNGIKQWSTYYGGTEEEIGDGLGCDGSGNVYLSGRTMSSNAISTVGAHQESFGGGSSDAFLVKFNSNGVRQWGTYYGGNNTESFSVMNVNNNNIYLAGGTLSSYAISTSGSYQENNSGGWDGFFVKFNSNGVRQWGTYYGGSNNDYIALIKINNTSGDIYIAGETSSSNGISTSGSQQESFGGGNYDGFLVKFNSNGVRQWGTYYGGGNDDENYDIDFDTFGNIFISGKTTSSNNIASSGAHQENYNGGPRDHYIVKFNSSGIRQWGTYYGGTGEEGYKSRISISSDNSIYLVGSTRSSTAISTSGAHQESLSGTGDAFLVKFQDTPPPVNLDSGLVAYYPFCGNARDESGNDNHGTVNGATLTTDRDGNANSAYSFDGTDDYISINDNSVLQNIQSNNLLTISAWVRAYDVNSYVPLLDKYESTGDDGWESSITVGSGSGIAFITRSGFGHSFSYSLTSGQWYNMVVTYDRNNSKLDYYINGNRVNSMTTNDALLNTSGEPLYIGYSPSQPDEYSHSIIDDIRIYNRALNTAEIDSLYKFKVNCSIYTSITTGTVNSEYCVGETIRIPYTANGTYNAGNVFTAQLSDASGNFASPTTLGTVTSTSSGTITATVPSGVSGSGFRVRVVSSNPAVTGSDNGVNITINPLPTPNISAGQTTVCARNLYPYTGNTSGGSTNKWTVSSGTISGADDGTSVNVIWGTASSGTVTLTQTNSTTGCKDSVKVTVTINPLPVPQITGTTEFCKGQTAVYKSNTATGLTYLWKVTNGTIVGATNRDSVIVTWDTATTGVIKLIQTTSEMCTDSTERNITVNPLPPVAFISAPNPVCEHNTYKYYANTGAGINYNWTVNGGTIDAGQGSATLTVTWGEAGNGYLKLTETYPTTGCLDTIARAIVINPLPIVAINGTQTAALNEEEKYYAVNKTNLSSQWIATGGTIQGNSTGDSASIIWTELGVSKLKLIQTDLTTGCIDSTEIDINVLENPPPDITILDTACENNESSYRTAYGKDLVYQWKATGGTITSPDNETICTVRWGQPGTARIKVITYNTKLSKYDSVEKVINVNPLPKPLIITSSDSAITGSTMKYWSTQTAVKSKKWKVTKGSILGADNKDTVDVKWTNEGKGTIRLVITSNAGCTDSTEKEITIQQKAGLRIYGRIEICENDTASYTTDNVEGATNKWAVTGGTIESESNTKINVTWGKQGTGKVKLEQDNQSIGIKDSVEIDVVINPLPNVTLNDFVDLCYKDTTYQLEGGKPTGGKYYFDDTVRTTFNPTKRGVGQHRIRYEYTDSKGCTNYAEKTFDIHPVPIAKPQADTVKVWSETKEEAYEWYYGDPLEKVSTDSSYAPPKEKEGEYFLKVINEYGCESVLSDGVIYFPPNPTGPRITSTGEFKYGTLICESYSNDTIQIKNIGSETLTITNAELIGENKDDFEIISPLPSYNIDIPSKQSLNYIVRFQPKSIGTKQAELQFESNDSKRPSFTIGIDAKKDSVGFELSDTIVKFEYVEENTKGYYDKLKIINTGTIDLRWQNPIIKINDDFDIMTIDPNPTLANGGKSDVTIRFNGGIKNYKTLYDYLLSEENCGRTVKLTLEAIVGDKPVDAMVVIRVDSSIKEYKPGEIVAIPIYLENSQNLNQTNITGFTADFIYNATMLVPIMGTPIGSRKNDIRTIPLTLPVNPKQSNILDILNFEATLGNDTTTVLSLENLKTIGDSIQIRKIDGRFTLAGVCMEGGVPRLLNTTGQVNLQLIKPNPTENKLTIDYEVIEKGLTEIYLMNSFGERIKTILSQEVHKGIYSIDADLGDISTGMYYIILQTPTVRKAVKVEIVK